MLNLYLLSEIFTSNFHYNSLNIISIFSILCGIFVIITKNPIVSVLFLIGLFITIAGYLVVLGINFIGLSYLLVYVGAVSILFLFILMLINVRVSELVTENSNSLPLAIMIGIIFTIVLSNLLLSNNINTSVHLFIKNKNFVHPTTGFNYVEKWVDSSHSFVSNWVFEIINIRKSNLSFVTSQIWDGILAESSHITSIGNIIYTVYPLWLILTSIILLLAMIGAIVITIKKQ